MNAVSNTTPLRYLIAIGQASLLGKLFQKVFLPLAVHDELTDVRAPATVRTWFASPPAWLETREVTASPAGNFPHRLHRGERDAILLAEALSVDVLLVDDRTGWKIAMERNLPVSGTLGVLERADVDGLLGNFPGVLGELRSSGFFITATLEHLLLERHRRRRAGL